MTRIRQIVDLRGIVQGIGLRPWALRTAQALQLAGSACHNTEGIRVELEGEEGAIDAWKARLLMDAPDGTQIEAISVASAHCAGEREFRIEPSEPCAFGGRTRTPVDIAACPSCVEELFDPKASRHRHPFTHCAQCGPRASILRDQPFDRERTSFAAFEPCETCAQEFEDPEARHFLDQTVSCPHCGPCYTARLASGQRLDMNPIELAAEGLAKGAIIALKGYGGFQFAVDATNHEAVLEFRERRDLPAKPFPVMVPTLDIARGLGVLGPEDEALLTGPERAIVVVPRRQAECDALGLSHAITPRSEDIGLVLPCHPAHYLLFWGPDTHPSRDAARFQALLLCSATLTHEPTIHINEDALSKLSRIADLFLEHDRDIVQPSDDPIFRSTDLGPIPLRLSRSTTPAVLHMGEAFRGVPPILAMGSDSRCAPAVFADAEIHLSAHIGNLIAEESADALVQFATEMCHRLRVFPEYVTHGLNPENLGTRIAQGLGTPTLPIQHHHAHAVSCMVDNACTDEVLALVLDGADWGDDHTLWGGELLRVTNRSYERVKHIEEIELPGGMETAKEPWRPAAVWLDRAFPDGDAPRLPWHARRNEGAVTTLQRMRERRINSPRVSSCGRLIDAMASLLDQTDRITYEGEAIHAFEALLATAGSRAADDAADAALTETANTEGASNSGDEATSHENGAIPVADLVRDLVLEHAAGADRHAIARRFYRRLARRLTDAVISSTLELGIDRVLLTGACFESRPLLETIYANLREAGLTPLTHRRIPPNDGGLAVGQAAIAAARSLDEDFQGMFRVDDD